MLESVWRLILLAFKTAARVSCKGYGAFKQNAIPAGEALDKLFIKLGKMMAPVSRS